MQIGRFSLAQRLGTMLLRGSQFFAVGCLASGLGHSLTMHLVRSCNPVTCLRREVLTEVHVIAVCYAARESSVT